VKGPASRSNWAEAPKLLLRAEALLHAEFLVALGRNDAAAGQGGSRAGVRGDEREEIALVGLGEIGVIAMKFAVSLLVGSHSRWARPL
jgi:hypothetical protein